VRKRFRLFVNHYDVFGQSPEPIAFVDAPRGGREVLTYRDDRRGTVDVSAKARDEHRWLDGFEVAAGAKLGVVRAESRWGPRQWVVEPAEREPLRARERSALGAFLRGIGGLFALLPSRFDFGAFTVHRRFGLTRYVVEFAADSSSTVDPRLVLALVVVLDAY